MKKIIFIFIFSLLFIISANAQQIDKITRRCPAPNTSVFASNLVTAIGDITYTPCPSRTSIFTGNTSFASGTYSFSGPSFTVSETTNNVGQIAVNSFVANHIFLGNAVSGVTGLDIAYLDASSNITIGATNIFIGNIGAGVTKFNSRTFQIAQRTITPAGTTGNVTINQSNGTVNFPAGVVTDITVTNNIATATSLIIVTPQFADASCTTFGVDNKAAGSFHIKALTGGCTAETSVAFWVFN